MTDATRCETCGRPLAETSATAAAESTVAAAAKKFRAELDAADARIIENDDHTMIVSLTVPITLAGQRLDRITVERARVRHVLHARDAPSVLEELARDLVRPHNAFDELESVEDFTAALRAAERALGKYQRGGRPSSPA